MGPKRAEVSKQKERVDRREQTKHKFDVLRLEVKYPGTAILLLQCQEKPVLLAAAAALAKYGSKAKGNLEVLFDLDIVDSVIALITHEDLFTRRCISFNAYNIFSLQFLQYLAIDRFAAKLLAEMVAIPNVLNFLLDSNYYIPHFTKVLINDQDLFMQEFSSLILAEMSKDPFGAAQMLNQCTDMDFLFERIQSPDPDVKKNSIEIIYNLLQDPTGAPMIIETKNFNLSAVYDLYNSPYPEIQKLALDVVTDLVSRNQDDHLQDLFRRSNGLQALLKFLDNIEWEDLHSKAFLILRLACDNVATAEMFDDIGGIKEMMNYLEGTVNSNLFMEALDVVVRLSDSPRGRHALYTYGIIDYLLRTLVGNVQPEIYEISCHGIGMMTLYDRAGKDLTASGCVTNILDIVKNENLKWSTRQAALFALKQLLTCDLKNCENFLSIQGQNYFLRMMKQPIGKVPVEVLVGMVKCFIIIARNQILRPTVVNVEVIDAMCTSFELTCPSMDDFKIACCNALAVLCMEKAGRAAFLKAHGHKRLYTLLTEVRSTPIRNAAAQLIQLLCGDPVLANAFVSAKYLNYMLNNRLIAKLIPSWDTCIEALFSAHLPIKFALTGRLSLHDVTKDGFYVLRRNVCKYAFTELQYSYIQTKIISFHRFPILDDIFRFKYCPMEPIYVVNCIRPRKSSIQEKIESLLSLQGVSSTSLHSISERDIFLSTEIRDLMMDMKFGRLQCDPCLYNYLELFKCKLIAAESKDVALKAEQGLVNVSYVASRAKMLAKFVAQQLAGPDPMITCVDHQLEIHLKQIKHCIETSVIPLGMLRVGSFLERALLFKVMADRIHLPAALVKHSTEKDIIKYYVEEMSCPDIVTLYDSVRHVTSEEEVSNESTFTDQDETFYPTKLLKPNFIVDLINNPGDLIPIDSRRAKMYCAKQLDCDTACEDVNV
nr:PREDICTED: armadillo repeat-containing protein 3 isoform X2 [Megachile rotundata]